MPGPHAPQLGRCQGCGRGVGAGHGGGGVSAPLPPRPSPHCSGADWAPQAGSGCRREECTRLQMIELRDPGAERCLINTCTRREGSLGHRQGPAGCQGLGGGRAGSRQGWGGEGKRDPVHHLRPQHVNGSQAGAMGSVHGSDGLPAVLCRAAQATPSVQAPGPLPCPPQLCSDPGPRRQQPVSKS